MGDINSWPIILRATRRKEKGARKMEEEGHKIPMLCTSTFVNYQLITGFCFEFCTTEGKGEKRNGVQIA